MGAGTSRSDRLKGARFGPHEIVRLIGHGATASVFEATHLALGKRVAVKLLHEHLAQDEQLAARFVREGQIAARLRHPNAIDVVDVGVEGGVPYLVMELLDGSDLRSLLADVKALSVEHALAFLLPIASALAYAHDQGVLHRDLKPANIVLSRDGRDEIVPKLVDFGLSKASAPSSTSSLTATELVAGTILYMAPEQTEGVKFASPASDQYSLAIVLYECLAGEPPFWDENVYALVEKIRTAPFRPPSAARAGVPPAIDAPILRAMKRDPAERYPSVRAFARDLLPFADDRTVVAVERDFVDRTSGADRAASRPSLKRASVPTPHAAAETRAEARADSGVVSSAGRSIARLPCPPGASPFHIKGIFYRGMMSQIAKTIGLDVFCAQLADEPLRAFARQTFLASARYDVLPFVPLVQTLAAIAGMRTDALVRASTQAQARYDAKHAYRMIFDSSNPGDVALRIPRFNDQVFDFGEYTARVTEPKHVISECSRMPRFLVPWFGPMHAAYAEEGLRIAGASDAALLSQVITDDGARDGFPLVTIRTELRWM